MELEYNLSGEGSEVANVQERIIRTDMLIDRIVYRLYGLTDEEIAVVEGLDR